MGNTQSRNMYWKLQFLLPDVHGHDKGGWFNKSKRPFDGDKDKEQFIYSVITVITQNGKIDLRDHSFRLLYSRRENDRIVARIVAERNGVINVKIDPEMDGEDHFEAFRALRKDVESKLERILMDLPNDASAVAPVSTAPPPPPARISSITSLRRVPVPPSNGQIRLPIDAPPAYGTGDSRASLDTSASSIRDISTNASQETLRPRQSKDTFA